MTASPIDDGLHHTTLSRTVRAVRAALPDAKRGEFMAELDVAEAGGLSIVLDRWWTRAVVWSSPAAMALYDAGDAGLLHLIPAEELFPELARRR